MTIQNEVMKIHFKYGTSELANYKIQILFDELFETYKSNLKTNISNIESLDEDHKIKILELINGN